MVAQPVPQAPYMTDEVAELFRIDPRTVLTLAKRGDLPAIRIGKLYRFPRAAIDAIASGDAVQLVARPSGDGEF